MEETTKSNVRDKIKKIVKYQKDALQTSRTAKLWNHYMEIIDILKMYIIWKLNNEKDAKITENVQYVLDGGALLHKIPWI